MTAPHKKIHTYETDSLQIRYDVKRCIHAAECVKRLNVVFDPKKKPWIQPEHASADDITATIHACPSGALQYTRKDGVAGEAIPDHNAITIETDGPLYLQGDLEMVFTDGTETDTRLALCRCGLSKHKPYCDNSHIEAKFAATDVLADNLAKSDDSLSATGHLTITPATDGPLLLDGEFELHSADRQTQIKAKSAALCRCGQSGNKPFCDGTHRSVGFRSGS